MHPHTLEKLEFEKIRSLLAKFALCGLGRSLAEQIAPAATYGPVVRWLEQVRQMQGAIEECGQPPLGGLHDIRELVRRSVPPSTLEPADFGRIAETLAATHALRRWFEALPDAYPLLHQLGQRVGDFQIIAHSIERAIDARGAVRDDATDKLRSIRQTITQTRNQVRVVMERLLRSPHVVRMLQYAGSTFHDDRVVLPLRAECRGRVPGIIHRSSDSGATLFVEPAEAVELNNTITGLGGDEIKEVTRILWGLARDVHQNEKEILGSLDALAELDLIVAKVRFAEAYALRCPELNRKSIVRLNEARHPLLMAMAREAESRGEKPAQIVPIDVRLGDDFDMLVITGPNTGGKTVALKTVGLLAAMVQSGLPIPVGEGSTIPVFDDVLIDVGDEQSLQQSLSTFSAHLVHLRETLRTAKPRTLVLIDELGAGTDPEEGAALGRAIMEELLRIGCRTMISTHLGSLKSAAYTLNRVDNASVEFDVQTLEPRYRLLIGEPGNSNALAIAARLGLPTRIIEAARAHLSSQHRAMQRAIKETSKTRRRAEKARRQADQAKRSADVERERLEKEAEVLRNRQDAFTLWTQRIATLKAGDAVHVARFDRSGTVVRMELHRQRAVINIGAMDVEVSISDINPI